MILIETNNSSLVNLEKVSNINFLSDKIVFNMSYSVTKNQLGRISDYFYLNNLSFYNCDYYKENFIELIGSDRKVAFNKNYVSYIKKDDKNLKLIIGFCNDVEKFKENSFNYEKVSEHYYIKFDSLEELNKNYNKLLEYKI